MAIHLYIPMEPLMGTEEQMEAHRKIRDAASKGYETYADMMGFFSIFSPKRAKAHKEAVKEYQEARDRYFEILRQS